MEVRVTRVVLHEIEAVLERVGGAKPKSSIRTPKKLVMGMGHVYTHAWTTFSTWRVRDFQ